MAWERFVSKVAAKTKPTISIRKCGQIGFSTKSTQEFNIMPGDRIIFYFDSETHRIGLQLVTARHAVEDKNAVPVGFANGQAYVNATAFLRFFDIPFGTTYRHKVRWDDELGFIIADLSLGKRLRRGYQAKPGIGKLLGPPSGGSNVKKSGKADAKIH